MNVGEPTQPERSPALIAVPEPTAAAPIAPVAPGERLAAIDTLRGFAIFGILLVNMACFSAPLYIGYMDTPWWTSRADRVVQGLILVLAESKFYTLFSFLFGFGMALQMQRLEARGSRFVSLYTRRLLVLLVIGVCHALYFWYGDVLTLYALLGFPLLLFRKRSSAVILLAGLLAYALPLLVVGHSTITYERQRKDPAVAAALEPWLAARDAELTALTQESVANYSGGSRGEILAQRLRDHAYTLGDMPYFASSVFTMFLLGLYVGRRGILHEPAAHARLLRWLVILGLPLGLLANAGYAAVVQFGHWSVPLWTTLAGYVCQHVGVPLLGFGYAAGIVLLVQRGAWLRRLAPLAAVGRMALTNYLLQTLICTALFYSYGLGWFGKVGPTRGLLLSLAIFAAQVPLSVLWLRQFRFGPLEWLWRSLTYLKWQPMRVKPVGLPPPTQGLIS